MKKIRFACLAAAVFLFLSMTWADAKTAALYTVTSAQSEPIATLIPVDVGNQNSYSDSGSDFDFDYDYDSDYSYDGDYSSGLGLGLFGLLDLLPASPVVVIIVVIVLIVMNQKKKAQRQAQQPWNFPASAPAAQPAADPAAEIAKTDPNFSESKFLSWAGSVFMTLNQAWTERNAEMFRPFESPELFLEHSRQIDEYIKLGRINYMQRIGIKESRLNRFYTDEEHEYMEVKLTATLIDYIMDEKTGNVISGSTDTLWKMEYTMEFMRTKGGVTPENPGETTTAHCPNCGAPVDITASGICEYCHSEVASARYNWVLNKYNGRNMGSC